MVVEGSEQTGLLFSPQHPPNFSGCGIGRGWILGGGSYAKRLNLTCRYRSRVGHLSGNSWKDLNLDLNLEGFVRENSTSMPGEMPRGPRAPTLLRKAIDLSLDYSVSSVSNPPLTIRVR